LNKDIEEFREKLVIDEGGATCLEVKINKMLRETAKATVKDTIREIRND
jgi:hypothetical protein